MKNNSWLAAATVLLLLGSSGPAFAPFGLENTTIDKREWTDEEIAAEMKRYKIRGVDREEGSLLAIVSGFAEAGKYWKDLESGEPTEFTLAEQRLQELRDVLQSVASVQDSALAGHLLLVEVEREGDWECFTSIGCYPKGWVVGVLLPDAEQHEDVCRPFRNNGWFCALLE